MQDRRDDALGAEELRHGTAGAGLDGVVFQCHEAFVVAGKVKIEVNEEGTEAAAVTEAMAMGSAYVEPGSVRELHLDSPFLYAVVDLTSGVPLFIGVLDDPS